LSPFSFSSLLETSTMHILIHLMVSLKFCRPCFSSFYLFSLLTGYFQKTCLQVHRFLKEVINSRFNGVSIASFISSHSLDSSALGNLGFLFFVEFLILFMCFYFSDLYLVSTCVLLYLVSFLK
jgi:hypothetical protein